MGKQLWNIKCSATWFVCFLLWFLFSFFYWTFCSYVTYLEYWSNLKTLAKRAHISVEINTLSPCLVSENNGPHYLFNNLRKRESSYKIVSSLDFFPDTRQSVQSPTETYAFIDFILSNSLKQFQLTFLPRVIEFQIYCSILRSNIAEFSRSRDA